MFVSRASLRLPEGPLRRLRSLHGVKSEISSAPLDRLAALQPFFWVLARGGRAAAAHDCYRIADEGVWGFALARGPLRRLRSSGPACCAPTFLFGPRALRCGGFALASGPLRRLRSLHGVKSLTIDARGAESASDVVLTRAATRTFVLFALRSFGGGAASRTASASFCTLGIGGALRPSRAARRRRRRYLPGRIRGEGSVFEAKTAEKRREVVRSRVRYCFSSHWPNVSALFQKDADQAWGRD